MRKRVFFFVMTVAAVAAIGCGSKGAAGQTELQRVRSGALDVVLLSDRPAIQHGRDTFTVEFRSASDGRLVDVGSVRGSATMPMAGMPMMGSLDVQRGSEAGRYAATCALGMAGTWRMGLEWEGPAGMGSVTFSGSVQ